MRTVRTAALILVLATGCTTPAGEPTPSDSPANPATAASPGTPPSAAVPISVTIRKSGGIAGINDTLVVDAQGNWTRTTRSGNKSGKLTPQQLAQAAKLATDPRLVTEAQTPRSTTNCADAISYAVTIQSATVSFSDCGSGTPPPATTELVRYLEEVTGG
jgi:hypothetical protein